MGGINCIKVRSDFLLPFAGRWIIVIIVSILGYIWFSKAMESGSYIEIGLILAILLLTYFILFRSKVVLKIDLSKKVIYEYTWFLGFEFGSTKSFNNLEKIFINRIKFVMKNQYMGPVNYRNLDSDVVGNYFLYKSFLKLDDGTKIFLLSHASKSKLIYQLKLINSDLKTELYDNSLGNYELL